MTPGIYDKYFFRGPYSSDCVWNLADNILPRREANLLSLVDLGNALRGMSKQDQVIHKFHMARVLSIKKVAWAAKAETESLLAEAQEPLQKATAKLQSIKRQHQHREIDYRNLSEVCPIILFDPINLSGSGFRFYSMNLSEIIGVKTAIYKTAKSDLATI